MKMPPAYGIALLKRVSTDDMQIPENSFGGQDGRIRDYLKHVNLDLPVTADYEFVVSTSGKAKRPDAKRILDDARKGVYSHLAVAFSDRIGRNSTESYRIVDELTDMGVTILAADLPLIDIKTATGNFMLKLKLLLAQHEVQLMSERIAITKKAILENGGWPATLPDSYVRSEE